MEDLQKIREFFKKDKFATNAGAQIDWVENDDACCSFLINENHKNAGGSVQGGAIFTLADFAFAVASNSSRNFTVSVDHTISFIKATKGTKLIATAHCLSKGKHMCFYDVKVTDDLDQLIATMSVTGYIKG